MNHLSWVEKGRANSNAEVSYKGALNRQGNGVLVAPLDIPDDDSEASPTEPMSGKLGMNARIHSNHEGCQAALSSPPSGGYSLIVVINLLNGPIDRKLVLLPDRNSLISFIKSLANI
ncbi:unnamed protein product [Ilex paraguariensis]|uniref:Uncharacterized protein n=1 Tax=Ilex paraguariensis TaxID=185542 RepID=A0ABC8RL53_9AQUA